MIRQCSSYGDWAVNSTAYVSLSNHSHISLFVSIFHLWDCVVWFGSLLSISNIKETVFCCISCNTLKISIHTHVHYLQLFNSARHIWKEILTLWINIFWCRDNDELGIIDCFIVSHLEKSKLRCAMEVEQWIQKMLCGQNFWKKVGTL